jgi:peptidoglycan LD-endopeptidase CwlK
MASRNLNDLKEPFQQNARDWLKEAQSLGEIVCCTLRTNDEQAALYAQGRQKIDAVNLLRQSAMLPAISYSENNIVTNAKPGDSFHNYGAAFDFIILNAGKIASNNSLQWDAVGEIGEQCGMDWAGRWKGKLREKGHFQMRGITLQELKAGKIT